MDLAKIREKSRLERENGTDASPAPPDVLEPPVALPGEPSPDRERETVTPAFVPVPHSDTMYSPTVQPRHPTQPRDPLKVIMAGREAAGLDGEGMLTTGETTTNEEPVGRGKYLCFNVADEVYGINIMDIKEIIRPREVTEVPRSPSFVSGVISLRGVIIPVIDMQQRLGLQRLRITGRERVVVVKNAESFSGLVVDEIIQVAGIDGDCIEAAPTVLEGIDKDFVSGIGRAGGKMVIILNLEKITDLNLF